MTECFAFLDTVWSGWDALPLWIQVGAVLTAFALEMFVVWRQLKYELFPALVFDGFLLREVDDRD